MSEATGPVRAGACGTPRPTWGAELRATARLSAPVVAGQLGMIAMGVVDLAMVGRLSDTEIAAAALGHVYSFGVLIFAMGALQVLDPLVAQAVGARQEQAVGLYLQRGALLALLLSIPVIGMATLAGPFFAWLDEPADVRPLATAYVQALIPGMIPFLLFVVLRQTLQALSRPRAVVVAVVLANLANAALDWMLIWGRFGLPALGTVGCALATSACRWLLLLLLLALGWRTLRPHLLPPRRQALDGEALARMLKLGAPIGGAHLVEYGAFLAVALLMGWFSKVAVASHQLAINLASVTFMVPLGIGSAAAVRVGYAVGRRDPAGARRAAAASLAAGAAVMACFAVLFLCLPRPFARFYTDQADVLAMTVLLIPLAGVFQVFDGVQVVAAGVLRGLGDTRTALLMQLAGFWLLGLPIGCAIAFPGGNGPRGLWWGLVVGLASVAIALLLRVVHLLRQPEPGIALDRGTP